MAHATVRATLTPVIIRLTMEKYSLSEKDALDKFYTSAAGASFADDETGLYGQSALYVFGVFDEEMKDNCKASNAIIKNIDIYREIIV